MRSNAICNKIDSLKVGEFISKENLLLDPLWIEVRMSQIKKKLLPKKFKSVAKHLVRIK